ncbi:MAG: 3-deoxy-7-phosphoheptulonate synthase, partial [Gammaproteobacteria bacterium]|nr:3-deoxy-7-phosphoheptulonate synthase [Gammaproteobacteria bacterium]
MANIQDQLQNVNVASSDLLATPEEVKRHLPLTALAADTVLRSREVVRAILERRDPRLFVVVGPCSIHDVAAAREYAGRLKELAVQVESTMLLIMRVYFEKPRTTVGWKGFINDPHLDETFDMNEGIRLARKLLLEVNEIGVACGTEFLDLITPQYIADLIAWGAIGARTTESQSHRQLASGLSCPVGFKNGTDGNIRIAVDAIKAASARHHFISVTKSGHVAVFKTAGNEDCHVILRGGKTPNYDAASIDAACRE